LPQSSGLQFALLPFEVAAGFTEALPKQELFVLPAAAGFVFALFAQQLFMLPAAAGFAFAVASGHAGVPHKGQPVVFFLHVARSQLTPPQLVPLHTAFVAAALIFSVFVQPYAAIPIMAMMVIVNTFFILFISG
jgi:hypothetical protein